MSLKKGLVLDLNISSEGLQGTTKFKDKTPYENNGTLSNVTLTTDHKGKANSAGLFNGTDSYIAVGTIIPTMKSISFWCKPSSISTTEEIINLNGTQYIKATNGTLSAEGFTSPTIYVNSLSSNTITTDWQLITITTETAINASDVDIGRLEGSSYFNGSIERPQIWNRALSADEIKLLYESYNPSLHIDSLQKGLVGHWTMSQDSLKGSLLADKTPYENDGIIHGATFTTDRKGQPNKCMYFDGVDDYVKMGNLLNFSSLSSFSVGAWIKALFVSGKANTIVTDSWIQSGRQGGWIFYTESTSGYLKFYGYAGSANGNTVDTRVVADNNWHYVVLNYNNKVVTFYVDGTASSPIAVSSIGNGNMSTSAYGSLIGANFDTSNITFFNNFNGLMDDVRIYNRALSQEEITKLYESYNK